MSQCYLLLGTNIGDKQHNLLQAQRLIAQRTGVVLSASSVYKTSAWGKEDQEDFLNQVLHVETKCLPLELLSLCLNIEKELGRVRFERWGERLIDIDILYFEDLIIEEEQLIVPHPELQNRRFTLVPLVEIAPEFVHPRLQKSNTALLTDCTDLLEVIKTEISAKDT